MFGITRRSLFALVLVTTLVLAGAATPAAAAPGDDCDDTDCVTEPGNTPELSVDRPFDGSPVDRSVDPVAVMPGDNVKFGAAGPLLTDEFQAFLKAKKAF